MTSDRDLVNRKLHKGGPTALEPVSCGREKPTDEVRDSFQHMREHPEWMCRSWLRDNGT